MAENFAAADSKLKIFISYSRRDSSEFAEELVGGLALAGFAPKLDLHDIAKGEDWEARLGGLIQEADTVVFVVSPASVKSERCDWEVKKSLALSKRLLPVVWIDVPEVEVPSELKKLNYTHFSGRRSFTKALAELATALRIDLDWIREHTRLGEVAARWHERGRPEELLLRGNEIKEARTWLVRRPKQAPEPTDIIRAYIAESGRSSARRQRNSGRGVIFCDPLHQCARCVCFRAETRRRSGEKRCCRQCGASADQC